MPIVKCQICGKQVNVPINWNRNERCTNCNGYFVEISQNQGYPSISNQLNQIGNDMGNNISSIPHIIIGKDKKTSNLNTQNTNLGYQTPPDEGYEKFEKYRQYGMWIIILLVVGYAAFEIFKIIFFGG